MDTEKLILLVKQNKAIYDAGDKNHRNRNYISSVWRSISAELNMPDESCKDKWHQLRSNYMRVKRNLKTKPSDTGASTSSKWPFFEILRFIDPFTEGRSSSGNVPQSAETTYQGNEFPDVGEESLIETETPVEESSSSKQSVSNPDLARSQFKRKSTSEMIDLQYLKELQKINESSPDENDPDRLFLLSLLPSVKCLSPEDNIDFKIQVLQILRSKMFPSQQNIK